MSASTEVMTSNADTEIRANRTIMEGAETIAESTASTTAVFETIPTETISTATGATVVIAMTSSKTVNSRPSEIDAADQT